MSTAAAAVIDPDNSNSNNNGKDDDSNEGLLSLSSQKCPSIRADEIPNHSNTSKSGAQLSVAVANGQVSEVVTPLTAAKNCDDDDNFDLGVTSSIMSIASTSVRDMDTLEVARQELGETDQVRDTQLRRLRKLISTSPQFRHCLRASDELNGGGVCGGLQLDDEEDEQALRFLLRFLRVNKFNVAKSALMLENFLKMRAADPAWHMGLGDMNHLEKALELVGNGYFFVAPGRDRMGRRVVWNLAQRLDPSRHSTDDMMKCLMMTMETVSMVDEESQVRGLTYVFDCQGLTLQHCRLWSPTEATRMLKSMEKNLPARHRAMFITNVPFIMGSLIELGKTIISAKIKNRIHVVANSDDLGSSQDALLDADDVIPSDLLPPDAPNTSKYTSLEMAQMWKQTVMQNAQHLKNLDHLILAAADKESGDSDQQCSKRWYSRLWSSS